MEYPVWFIPGISKGIIIGVISVLHVFIAQFAVGGGIYLAWMEGRAHKLNSPELLAWLQRHTHFFLLLTMVFGGLSGVAIWFAITVSSPETTSMLTRSFLFIWAAEWAFFLIEIVSLLVYYYTYPLVRRGAFSPSQHVFIGWIYAFAGFMSLFLINGIISFMLTPGESLETGELFKAFFNPTFWSSTVYRTALCLMLAGMFALFTATRIPDIPVRRMVTRSAGLWICLPLLALIATSAWYFADLPPDRQASILRRTVDIHPFAAAYAWVLPLVFMAGVAAFIFAQRLRKPLVVLILATGLMLVGSFEWVRETGRRPWVIPGFMYSNGVTAFEGQEADKNGITALSGWSKLVESRESDDTSQIRQGALIFSQQCSSCHAVGGPRLDIIPILKGLSPGGVSAQLAGQGKRLNYMPPFFGSKEDRDTLAQYLNSLRER